jgi:NAD(P)-dependent dehydrogenase (short-subunit alcohol dehydrogenase family)
MARVFITGSTDGLGRAAARTLLQAGHDVILHARSQDRTTALGDSKANALEVVIGDLGSAAGAQSVAEQVNAIGRMDAVIHNAGTYMQPTRRPTPEGHAITLAVNTLAPYIMTALIARPSRLVYLSSGLHRSGGASLQDMDWTERPWNAGDAYAESKLFVTALAFAIARLWPDVRSHAVDPGWVPTKMGGPNATDDLEQGHLTQTWLATSNDPGVKVSGYWRHLRRQAPAPEAADTAFQDKLLAKLAELTGIHLPSP